MILNGVVAPEIVTYRISVVDIGWACVVCKLQPFLVYIRSRGLISHVSVGVNKP